jgi:citrate lyase beta subunit
VGVGLVQPIDTIFANISNLDGLSMTVLCIRPAQVPVIDRVFAPNAHGVGS